MAEIHKKSKIDKIIDKARRDEHFAGLPQEEIDKIGRKSIPINKYTTNEDRLKADICKPIVLQEIKEVKKLLHEMSLDQVTKPIVLARKRRDMEEYLLEL